MRNLHKFTAQHTYMKIDTGDIYIFDDVHKELSVNNNIIAYSKYDVLSGLSVMTDKQLLRSENERNYKDQDLYIDSDRMILSLISCANFQENKFDIKVCFDSRRIETNKDGHKIQTDRQAHVGINEKFEVFVGHIFSSDYKDKIIDIFGDFNRCIASGNESEYDEFIAKHGFKIYRQRK